jgi:membrane protein YdbS with pleckstrin-like domain
MTDEAATAPTGTPASGPLAASKQEAVQPAPGARPEVPASTDTTASIADGVARRLDPRFVGLSRRRRFVVSTVLALALAPAVLVVAFVAGVHLVTLMAVLGWLTAVLLLAWQSWSWPPLAHRYASYSLSPQGLEIRHGVVFRRVVNVPRSRVQHTDVSQGPVERSFGLGRLVVFTAGSSYARVELQGLDHATALRIRDFLLQDEGSDAV